ncbi:MAG: hypothetical protein DCF21_18475 [Leptolyngbya sp.]|nr:MAG: hypothetical protein DCF21_18475 [Leptolyngbya sp.]
MTQIIHNDENVQAVIVVATGIHRKQPYEDAGSAPLPGGIFFPGDLLKKPASATVKNWDSAMAYDHRTRGIQNVLTVLAMATAGGLICSVKAIDKFPRIFADRPQSGYLGFTWCRP